jgi:hypothetical protein
LYVCEAGGQWRLSLLQLAYVTVLVYVAAASLYWYDARAVYVSTDCAAVCVDSRVWLGVSYELRFCTACRRIICCGFGSCTAWLGRIEWHCSTTATGSRGFCLINHQACNLADAASQHAQDRRSRIRTAVCAAKHHVLVCVWTGCRHGMGPCNLLTCCTIC